MTFLMNKLNLKWYEKISIMFLIKAKFLVEKLFIDVYKLPTFKINIKIYYTLVTTCFSYKLWWYMNGKWNRIIILLLLLLTIYNLPIIPINDEVIAVLV